uniref:zinc finger protein 836-like n=1 Tax=Myxine glutinosa TaxID=7769 RepID=UPI00358E6C0A
MDETNTFPAWLQARGLKWETAQAVVTELDMQSKGIFIACAESPTMRPELFSRAKQRLPFSMYSELTLFVESLWNLQSVGRPVLVEVLYSMLSAISLELASCAKKLISLDAVDRSQGGRRIELGEEGIRIMDICSLNQQQDEMNSPPSAFDDCGEETAADFLTSDVDPEMEEIVQLHSCPAECDVSLQTVEGIQQNDDYDDDGDDKVLETTLPEIGELDAGPMDEKHFGIRITIPSSSQELLSNVHVKQESCSAPKQEPAFETTSTVVEPSDTASIYSCSRCTQLFLDEDALLLHMERLHRRGRLHKCSVCEMTFAELRMLQTHMAVHNGMLPHKCPICPKRFARVWNMQLHMRIHTGERPYNCSVCGKRFSQRPNVKSHMRIHTGERPYKCSICGKGFSQMPNMKSHMRIHTGERPYKCAVCGKDFSQKVNMKSHMKSHQQLNGNGPL